MTLRIWSARRSLAATTSICGLLLLQGCAGGVSSADVASYDSRLGQGDYHGAAAIAVNNGKIAADGSSPNLLWALDAGAAMTYVGQSAQTIQVLDHAEDMIKRRDLGSTKDSGQYRAKTYDGVMLNTYKAIAAMAAGQSDVARTEMLRAEDRQRRAEDEFQAEVEAGRKAQAGSGGFNLDAALGSAQNSPEYRAAMDDMARYGVYKPFVNPFATYLSGLYFLNSDDGSHEKARNAFQRVRGMVGPGSVLDEDIKLAQQPGKFSPKTWVIYENGQGATLSEYSITFPVPLIGRHAGVSVATVAMPRLHQNMPAANSLLVGASRTRSSVVGNFDTVMASEFRRRYPSILRAALLEAAVKIAVQNVAAQEKTGIALLAATVASNVSSADTRSWSALPKEFQVARIETPKDGVVPISTDAGVSLGTAHVPTDASSIVYVKQLRPGSPAAIQVLKF